MLEQRSRAHSDLISGRRRGSRLFGGLGTLAAALTVGLSDFHKLPDIDQNHDGIVSYDEIDKAIGPLYAALREHYTVRSGTAAPTKTVVERYVLLPGGRLRLEIAYQFAEEIRVLRVESTLDTITVSADTHLVLPPRRPNGYGNHSCDPNLWWVGRYELAARRDLGPGEELTNDYATSTGEPDFVMTCSCGSAQCRGNVSGDDWRRLDLRTRYGRHWVPALLDRIDSAEV